MELLPEIPVPNGFAKPTGSDEPLFWIREIRFLRSWKDGKADEIAAKDDASPASNVSRSLDTKFSDV